MEVTEDSREDFIHDQLIETSNDNPFRGSYWHKGGFQLEFGSISQVINHMTCKSFSEALILASLNQNYDERLFVEFQEKYKFTTCCVQILF